MTQPQRLTQAERTDLSDRRMLDAAIALLVERGVADTTLKEVGERAGYSRGLAGYRFGSKTGLFEFVVRSIGDEWLAELKSATAGLIGADALAAAAAAHHRFCIDRPHHAAAFYQLWFASVGPRSEVRDVIAGIHARRHRDVAGWVRDGIAAGQIDDRVEPEAVAGQFGAAIVGILYQWLLTPDDHARIRALYDNLNDTMRLWLDRPQQEESTP